jgi:hypothetical protein
VGRLRRWRAGRLRQCAERLQRCAGRLRWRAAAVALDCGGAWLRRRWTTVACGHGGAGDHGEEAARARSGGILRRRIKRDLNERLKRLRSAFHAMTGRDGRLTGRGGAASSQSPVSSWSDRTRPVRDDRTLIESGQRLPGKLKCMTGRVGGGRDRTRWSQRRIRCSVRSQILEKFFGMTGHAGGHRDRTQW